MKKLEWDTKFWGLNIYDMPYSKNVTLSSYNISDERYLIQALVDPKNLSYIHELESKGFRFQEIKVTLMKKILPVNKTVNRFMFKEISPDDLAGSIGIFSELFWRNSRYNVFSEEIVGKFYYTWMINSIIGKMDDKSMGYYVNDTLAGFVTYKIRNSSLIIGLFGVMPEFQGQGFAQNLLNFVSEIAIENEVELISVDTQGQNVNALNAYIKNGFKIDTMKHWYYKKNF